MSRGVIYAATGEKYIREAIISAKTVRQHMPEVGITLFTDQPVEEACFDHVEVLQLPFTSHKGVKLYKPLAMARSPYENTLFLDSDTYLCDDCSELFKINAHVDLALAHDTADMSTPTLNGETIEGIYPYNSGVLAFRKSETTKAFFEHWYQVLEAEYDDHPWDQRAMMSSIFANGLKTYLLHPIYNCRTNFIVSLPQLPVKIIHGRDIDFELVKSRLNRVTKNRVWMHRRQDVMLKKKRSWLAKIFQKSRQALGTALKTKT